MKTFKVAALLLGAALLTGIGATSALAKCSGEKNAMPASKCSGEKKAMTNSKCSGDKKMMMNGKCGNKTVPAAPMKGKCGKGKCGS
jgi:hypothetical protein